MQNRSLYLRQSGRQYCNTNWLACGYFHCVMLRMVRVSHLFRPESGETLRGLPFELVAPAQLHYAPPLEGGGAGCDLRLERTVWIVLARRLQSQRI